MAKTLSREVAFVDFETEAIQPRPHYPPKPVGCAVLYPNGTSRYLSWGHPTNNNITEAEAKEILEYVWKEYSICFHNGKFDLEVAEKHLGLTIPDADDWHDTMLLAYLNDPHSTTLALKPLAELILNRQPDERDAVRDWVLANVPDVTPSKWGAYIAKAPGDLVGEYAVGDVEMTAGLFRELFEKVAAADMLAAYHREKELIPVLLQSEAIGIKVDVVKLGKDITKYQELLSKIHTWVCDELKCAYSTNLDSSDELAIALDKSGKAANWMLTPTGKRSTSKASLANAIGDPMLSMMLDYRSTLNNYMRNFMLPWFATATETNGWIYTQWHSTKQEDKGGSRTGRLASTPNLQNVPSMERMGISMEKFEPLFKKETWLLPLPHVRSYVTADEQDWVLIDRDYSQQEPRVLAHFEDGDLCAAYQQNPRMDIYIFGIKQVKELTGIDLTRKMLKTLILAIMYGVGLGKLADNMKCTVEDARKFKQALLQALPGIQMLTKDLQRRGKLNLPMRTWGGRVYYVEPPKLFDGQVRDFGYKLVNYLIQGSSADITKEAMIRYSKARKHGRLVLTVHDELLATCPKEHMEAEMEILSNCMSSIELDVPLVSDGAVGYYWGALDDVE
jgi:DNA polymerase I-like protein with 3'-5' exonuclease and polymerase domains